eukprot:scaffold25098_cov64-Cyclotella_meneghiniana.AAC.6
MKELLFVVVLLPNSLSAFINCIPSRNVCTKTCFKGQVVAVNQTNTSWDQNTCHEAAKALVPVLFPIHNDNVTATSKPVTAEVALKKLLRSRYQKNDHSQTNHSTASTVGDSRDLATLILGTSVMRLRHWYVVVNNRSDSFESAPPIPYPLDASIFSLVQSNSIYGSGEKHHDELLFFVKAMVDEHIKYVSNKNQPLFAFELKHNPAVKLSLEYSVPIFITEALFKHYGYTVTKEIFTQSNKPGPVTIRKNSINFNGSDEELCRYLMNNDGVHAVPMRSNQYDQNLHLTLHTTADGHSRYKVDSICRPGTILSPKGCIRILQSEELSCKTPQKKTKSIWSMRAWQEGYFEVQDAGSQVIVLSLEASTGDSVLDYCAGNGGKTFGIASILSGKGAYSSHQPHNLPISKIVAHDVVEERLRQIKGSMTRIGFTKERSSMFLSGLFDTYSSREGCKVSIVTSADLEKLKSESSKFDIVLVDAPCSSTGVFRRRPSQRWSLTEEEVFKSLPKLQLQILMDAAAHVKNGGKLIYSTCSLLREENDDVVSAFERSEVYSKFQRWNFNASGNHVSTVDGGNALTIIPSGNSDGFFIARWRKRG